MGAAIDYRHAYEGRLLMAHPVLASLDLDRTMAFYRDKLGFAVAAQYPDYGIATRDDVELHFWLCTSRHIAENTSAYLSVANVDRLYKDMNRVGVRITAPHDMPYGMREINVWDPDGNLLKFGEVIAPATEQASDKTA